MNFVQSVGSGFKGYADFSGRASRAEFWWWMLFSSLSGVVSVALDIVLSADPLICTVVLLAILSPSVAVSVRRLHDLDKSGWWFLIGFIPIIGAITLIFWYTKSGTASDNTIVPDHVPSQAI